MTTASDLVVAALAVMGIALFLRSVPDRPGYPDIGPAGASVLRGKLEVDVQAELTALQFDPGPIDGQIGPRTRHAIRAFRAWSGVAGTDDVDLGALLSLKQRP